ncbi:MAG: 23S rRNA (adenine(2503)-C(2))-methyltransferase RlmN [Thermoguttaceae bacterium]
MPLDSIKAVLAELGVPAYRLAQIRKWIFARKTDRFELMNDLPKELRKNLAEKFASDSVFSGKIVAESGSRDKTEKILIEFPDAHQVECVLLTAPRQKKDVSDSGHKKFHNSQRGKKTPSESDSCESHRTGCISTQVGCAMGCLFCASGLDGFVRNLTSGEILEQILRLNQRTGQSERLTHLVIMGTGEPLLNLDALLPALEEATATDGLDLSARRITISTVGIPSGIAKLAECGHPYKLAISLHAPNDELRSEIVPQNRFSGILEILRSSEYYFKKSGRRVTFEYVLIQGKNDQDEHARQLAQLLRGKTAIVNLIPFNPVIELPYKTPSVQAVRRFVEILESSGIQVKIRFRKGDQIDAACGQLRRRVGNAKV